MPTAAALQRQPGSNAPPAKKPKRGREELAAGDGGARAKRGRAEQGEAGDDDDDDDGEGGGGGGGGGDDDDDEPAFRQLLQPGEGAPRNPRLDYARPNRLPGQVPWC